ncbi:MAG TPA: hypothetical protein PKC21_05825 [Oligoflexia bacterium]|nr:hypothetical protein [Oligoflexia bacterium]
MYELQGNNLVWHQPCLVDGYIHSEKKEDSITVASDFYDVKTIKKNNSNYLEIHDKSGFCLASFYTLDENLSHTIQQLASLRNRYSFEQRFLFSPRYETNSDEE